MTTEDDFQNALDANPADWQTRLVFADWLEEHGDLRAAGYRVLGTLRVYPRDSGTQHCWSKACETSWCLFHGHEALDDDWFDLLTHKGQPVHAIFKTRRKAEDAAARTFVKLPEARRAELLAGKCAVPARPAAEKPKKKRRAPRKKKK